MKRMWTNRIAVAVVTMAAMAPAGCGDGTVATTPEQACAELASAYCSKLAACAPILVQVAFGDPTRCATRMQIECVPNLKLPGTGQTPAGYSTCAKAFGGVACADVFSANLPASCLPQPGQLTDGMPCGDDSQCKSTYCIKNGDCGVCGQVAAEGKSCADTDCARGLDCNAQDVCVKPGAKGAACDGDRPCGTGLSCFNSVCTEELKAGQACDPLGKTTPACDSLTGVYCNAQTKVCTTVQLASAGQPCGIVGGAVAVCTAAGRCQRPSGSLSGSCLAAAADGAACDETKGPSCMGPATCKNSVCTVPNYAACK